MDQRKKWRIVAVAVASIVVLQVVTYLVCCLISLFTYKAASVIL